MLEDVGKSGSTAMAMPRLCAERALLRAKNKSLATTGYNHSRYHIHNIVIIYPDRI